MSSERSAGTVVLAQVFPFQCTREAELPLLPTAQMLFAPTGVMSLRTSSPVQTALHLPEASCQMAPEPKGPHVPTANLVELLGTAATAAALVVSPAQEAGRGRVQMLQPEPFQWY